MVKATTGHPSCDNDSQLIPFKEILLGVPLRGGIVFLTLSATDIIVCEHESRVHALRCRRTMEKRATTLPGDTQRTLGCRCKRAPQLGFVRSHLLKQFLRVKGRNY